MRSFVSVVLVVAVAVVGVASMNVSTEAQSARTGIVTALDGSATVARISLATPAPLKFKDEIYTQDRITTDKDSLVKVLLGGKALITIRERTVVTIHETPGIATIKVNGGRVRVDVVKTRMKSGEVVDIVTPNAVGTVRGTVVVAEVEGPMSTLTVLTGLIDVTRIDTASGNRVGRPVPLGNLQQMTLIGKSPLPAPRTLTPEGARQLGSDFRLNLKAAPHGGAVNNEAVIKAGAIAATAVVLPGAVDRGDKGRRTRDRRELKDVDQSDAPDSTGNAGGTNAGGSGGSGSTGSAGGSGGFAGGSGGSGGGSGGPSGSGAALAGGGGNGGAGNGFSFKGGDKPEKFEKPERHNSRRR